MRATDIVPTLFPIEGAWANVPAHAPSIDLARRRIDGHSAMHSSNGDATTHWAYDCHGGAA
jgi:hypothetical protein